MQHTPRPAFKAGFDFLGPATLVAVLVFAPLIMGGNRPVPLLILELAALGLFAHILQRPAFRAHLPKSFLAALGLFALLPLLQLVPLPESAWSALPGREAYAATLAALSGDNAVGSRSFSLVPYATEAAWLTLLPPLAVFLLAVGLPDRQLKLAVFVFLGMATFQAVLGLAQYGTGSVAVLLHGPGLATQNARGTYASYDHLAGLLEMALPIALGMLAYHWHGVRQQARRYHGKGLRARLARFLTQEAGINRTFLFAAMSLAILLGLVFTRSRSGIALAMLGILLAALLFARRVGGRISGVTTVLGVLGIALAVEIGLVPVLQRFGMDATEDARWSIFAGSLGAIREFLPLGSGVGTYPEVFRGFQPAEVSGHFINHAHNDYLEWLAETGLVGGALALVFLGFYIYGWRRVWKKQEWTALRFMQLGAGISLLLLMLHSLVDFNLHIPANAIYFAFLAAVFLHRQETQAPRATAAPKPAPRTQSIRPPVPAKVPNPFEESPG